MDFERNEVGFIFNDDLYFKPGRFSDFFGFIDNIETESERAPRYYSVVGDEVGAGALGDACPQGMACCAMNAAMYREVGPFDENFSPAYYEDCDYFYRMKLLGHSTIHDTRNLCVHERNKSSLTNAKLAGELQEMLDNNKRYYIEKWGGEPHKETYSSPFDSH